jgi:hypothetical protein
MVFMRWAINAFTRYLYDKNIDDIWWLFQEGYLELVIVNVCMLLLFEIVRKLVPVKWRPIAQSV